MAAGHKMVEQIKRSRQSLGERIADQPAAARMELGKDRSPVKRGKPRREERETGNFLYS